MKHTLLTIALIFTHATSAAAANFFGNSITLLSNSKATSAAAGTETNLCTESAKSEASKPPNSNYALLTDLQADSRKGMATLLKLI